jgi:hypothetical protein
MTKYFFIYIFVIYLAPTEVAELFEFEPRISKNIEMMASYLFLLAIFRKLSKYKCNKYKKLSCVAFIICATVSWFVTWYLRLGIAIWILLLVICISVDMDKNIRNNVDSD